MSPRRPLMMIMTVLLFLAAHARADQAPETQRADGSITLPARTAEVHGTTLRYEPQPTKNTLGFWTRGDDWASWDFEVKASGTFAVTALVGCGTGSGGSAVEFRAGGHVLKLTVPVTGGFQKFETQELGRLTLDRAGLARLEVHATSKPGAAVMDLREVRLVPVAAAVGLAEPKVTHAFFAAGGATYIRDGEGKILWKYPQGTRDGWVLPNGNRLLAVSKCQEYPGGGAVEVTPSGEVLFEYKGTQSEVNTVQAVVEGLYMLTEAGDRPRLLEVDRQGKVLVEVPLKAQTRDHHLQTRMARKLANGHYLVPQLLDKVVREYTPAGEVVWEVKTADMPFTAIRLDNGHTLIGCTLGNYVIEVDRAGKTVWRVGNDDLPGDPINDACGVQRLPNGNTVITSHHARGDEVKLIEVTRGKEVVWTHRDPTTPGIHHFQILDTNGKALEGRPLR